MDKLKIVYDAIVKEIEARQAQLRLDFKDTTIEESKKYYNFCQSWWIKTECNMKTAEITRIGKKLAKMGYLEIDYKNTSTSTGTRFIPTTKIYTALDSEHHKK